MLVQPQTVHMNSLFPKQADKFSGISSCSIKAYSKVLRRLTLSIRFLSSVLLQSSHRHKADPGNRRPINETKYQTLSLRVSKHVKKASGTQGTTDCKRVHCSYSLWGRHVVPIHMSPLHSSKGRKNPTVTFP